MEYFIHSVYRIKQNNNTDNKTKILSKIILYPIRDKQNQYFRHTHTHTHTHRKREREIKREKQRTEIQTGRQRGREKLILRN